MVIVNKNEKGSYDPSNSALNDGYFGPYTMAWNVSEPKYDANDNPWWENGDYAIWWYNEKWQIGEIGGISHNKGMTVSLPTKPYTLFLIRKLPWVISTHKAHSGGEERDKRKREGMCGGTHTTFLLCFGEEGNKVVTLSCVWQSCSLFFPSIIISISNNYKWGSICGFLHGLSQRVNQS